MARTKKSTEKKELHGVVKLTSGRYKMIGIPHDKTVVMVLPKSLVDAWDSEAQEQKLTRTDLCENSILSYLKSRGWNLGA